MDGLSAAASVIDVIEGALITLQYAKDVVNSGRDRRRLASEVESLRNLLKDLQEIVEEARKQNGKLSVGVGSLRESHGLLSQINEAADQLEKKLSLGKGNDSKWRRVARALKWSLDKRSCSEIVAKIERLGVSMIALLQADSLYLIPLRCSKALRFSLTTDLVQLDTRSKETRPLFSRSLIAQLKLNKTCKRWAWIRSVSF
jgi:hypothetical protein